MKRSADPPSSRRRDADSPEWPGDSGLRTLIENLPGAVYRCALGPPARVLEISDGVLALTGRPAAEWTQGGPSPSELVHPDDLEGVERAILAAVADGRPYDVEYRVPHADGSVR